MGKRMNMELAASARLTGLSICAYTHTVHNHMYTHAPFV